MITLQGRKVVSTFLLVAAMGAHAGSMGNTLSPYYKNIEISGAGGVNWYNVSNDAKVVVSPFETDSLLLNDQSVDGAWKIGLGYFLFEDQLSQRKYFNHLLFEVNVGQTFATLNGAVWQFQLPEFYNYNFRAPITSTRLMFDFKPNLFTWKRLTPYAILGIGASWNRVSYHETAFGMGISQASAESLSSSTNTQLSWDTGAGMQVRITDRLSATLEYVYAFLGHGSPSANPTNGVNLYKAPRFSLETNILLFGLSFKS